MREYFSRRKLWIIFIFILTIILLCTALFFFSCLGKNQLIGYYVCNINTDIKVIALTFDDGPNPPITKKILDLLKKYNAKATFFVLGKNAKAHLDILREIYSNENEIGNHSWNHEKLVFKSLKYVKQEIQDTDRIIRDSGYTGTIHFRSPFGSRFIILPYLLMKAHRIHILWNIGLNDWANPDPEVMLHNFDNAISSGSIVLLHDGYPNEMENRTNTVKTLELILSKYTQKGYKFITVSELLKLGKPRSGFLF